MPKIYHAVFQLEASQQQRGGNFPDPDFDQLASE
jgi:hypothetical protein